MTPVGKDEVKSVEEVLQVSGTETSLTVHITTVKVVLRHSDNNFLMGQVGEVGSVP